MDISRPIHVLFIVSIALIQTVLTQREFPGFGNNLQLNSMFNTHHSLTATKSADAAPLQPCTCAVFLTGQFTKGSPEPPVGNPALLQEQEKSYPCTSVGNKQCQSKCLETIIKYLPNSAEILCATIDRDCHKERAYLFIQNCNTTWQNSNLSAGREYCCKDGLPYTCPLL